MRKVIAAINMTIDGSCDHTAGLPDEEIHHHYADLLKQAGVILYGRITYELMEFWRPIAANPTGNKAMDEFAVIMDNVPKIIFSNTLKELDWETAKLAMGNLKEVVVDLKSQPGKDIYIGSRSLIIQLLNLNLIDELQLCIHPVVAKTGMPLFENLNHRTIFTLAKTKAFGGGAVILYYEPKIN